MTLNPGAYQEQRNNAVLDYDQTVCRDEDNKPSINYYRTDIGCHHGAGAGVGKFRCRE